MAVNKRIDLRAHYSPPYRRDPIFALKPDSTVEQLVEYWKRIVLVSYDQNSGLISLTTLGFDPETSHDLAIAILEESQILMNALNATARADSLKYAEEDLKDAVDRLKSAREALVRFRTRTQIVDPESDLRGRMGVLNSLQQQLAQAMVDYDIIAQDSGPEDPRVVQALRRIEVIRTRLAAERANFAEQDANGSEEAYPALMAEYEGLIVDREFAEEAYRVALATLDSARSNAARQSRYLSTYIQPTIPETAEFPRRVVIFALAGLFLLLLWVILSLMYYAIRDRN
ncbi:MAG TPA: sugar transporter [Aliiroseovarius sp.]|nr:sugar transporter [Aliiroseovarius sp.]